MKLIKPLFYFTLGVIALALTFVFPDMLSIVPGTGSGVSFAMSYLAHVSDDRQLWHKWGKKAQKLGEKKTEFKESDIGVTWGDDGPEKSDQVPASPIKLVEDLKDGGKYMDIKIDAPLKRGPSDILNTGRINDQDRIGAEEELKRYNFTVALDKLHVGIGEKEIEDGLDNTANMTPGKFMQRMVEALTDHNAQRKDYGTWFAACGGADIHHYLSAADRADLSNGAVPIGDPKMGLMHEPREHGRAFVWQPDNTLKEVDYDDDVDTYEGNLVTELSKITDAATPGLKLFKRINRKCLNSDMIPCVVRDQEGAPQPLYVVYVPGSVRDLAEEDESFEKVMNSAYQGNVRKHPILRTDDIVYKNLVIRESVKLDSAEDDYYFSAKSSFNAIDSETSETTKMTFNRNTVNNIEKLSLSPGKREFAVDSDADTAFGGTDNMHLIKRIFVCGAGAIARATGKQFELKKLEVTQYGLKDGIGRTSKFGQMRNEQHSVKGAYEDTPQSFEVFCLGEE